MSSANPGTDLGVEREIDLARWRRAARDRWWVVAAGAVAGIVIGGLYSLSGGGLYKATAELAPGQPLSPSGQPVLTYRSSPVTIAGMATSESVLRRAADKVGIPVAKLRGHVSTSTVLTGVGSAASRSAILIDITVQLPKAKEAEDAANEIAALIKADTTSEFVVQSIATYKTKIASFQAQLDSIGKRISTINDALKSPSLDFTQRLILVSEVDNAEQRQGNLNDKLTTAQDQLTLAEQIEIAQVIEPAVARHTVARSRRNSILVGMFIGLILGAVAALAVDARANRARTV